MTDPVQQFYDGWADEYHLIFDDWKQSIQRQGKILDDLIQTRFGSKPKTLLDCTCGIGTQSIGLATHGYQVTASDLSPKAVQRATKEAQAFGVSLCGQVADLRSLNSVVTSLFDVVLTCDNSICHLLEPDDLHRAARQMKERLKSGGLFLASIRDYDLLRNPPKDTFAAQQLPGDFKPSATELPRATIPRIFDQRTGRRIVFQVWDWSPDGSRYAVNQFTVTGEGKDWKTTFRASRFRALLRGELTDVLRSVGFKDIRWHMPEESGFYQPIVTARAEA